MLGTWKTVRVFISSTFRDMHSERDWLVKRVFPALRERLEKYRIHLVDIDLRWGVTQEQADNDMALDLCLAQIDESRPFFIGILGERYGFVPEHFREDAVSRFGWIQHHTGKSITELEILYGVLRKHEMQSRAFFFFRDNAFENDVPEAKRGEVRAESEESADKLRQLKQANREADLPAPPVENYPCRFRGLKLNWRIVRSEFDDDDRALLATIAADGIIDADEYARLEPRLRDVVHRHSVVHLDGLEAFGHEVEARLWEGIQAEHSLPDVPPTFAETDPLAEEADYHERFMESRLRVFVGRERDRRDLDRFADGDDEVVCLVRGEPGSGKSALLARFVTDYRNRHPEAIVIPHFVGASPASGSLPGSLRRLCGELKARFGFELPIPEKDEELPTIFRTYLTLIPTDRRVVLVLDALNQMDEAQQAHELHWMPETPPPHVKIIVSCTTPTTPDRAAETILARMGERSIYDVTVHGLTNEERFEIVHRVPSLSAKALDAKQIGLLLANPATTNPLFLLVALEELRGFGSFEQLHARIDALPREGDTLTALFIQVLERLEDEFGQDLTRTVLTLLASARRGLSEQELQALTSSSTSNPKSAIRNPQSDNLFPLLRQLRPYLLPRGDLLDFYHRSLAVAVQDHFLKTPELEAAAHRRLADYFERQSLTPRKVEELPWQLAEAGQWRALYDQLADVPFFTAIFDANNFDVRTYWSQVERRSSLRMGVAYAAILDAPADYPLPSVYQIAALLSYGYTTQAESLITYLVECHRRQSDCKRLSSRLNDLSTLLLHRGDLGGALVPLQEAERLCRSLGYQTELQRVIGIRADILARRRDRRSALDLLQEQERICGELGDTREQLNSLHNQAVLRSLDRACLDEAMTLCRRVEQGCRENGDLQLLGSCLHTQGRIFKGRRDWSKALELLKQCERICRQLGQKADLGMCLFNQASIQLEMGERANAIRNAKEAVKVLRTTNNAAAVRRGRFLLILTYFGVPLWLVVFVVLFLPIPLLLFGLCLGLWKPSLWTIGAPMVIVSIVLFTSFVIMKKTMDSDKGRSGL